jgi:hypothetical protein
MSSEYGFWGETKLDEWNAGTKRAATAMEKGDTTGALIAARSTVESYLKYRTGTDTRGKIFGIAALVIVALTAILGLADGEWSAAIIVGVIALIACGFLYSKTVSKRKAVCNAFFDSYEHLVSAIESLQKGE